MPGSCCGGGLGLTPLTAAIRSLPRMLLTSARPVVLITGISASGKTTVAELLARRFDAVFTSRATCSGE